MRDSTHRVLAEVAAERARQDEKHGIQGWPNGTGHEAVLAGGEVRSEQALFEVRQDRAQAAQYACDQALGEGRLTYRHILEEEVAEARAEHDAERLRTELVQVAAVAVAWVEKLDREAGRG